MERGNSWYNFIMIFPPARELREQKMLPRLNRIQKDLIIGSLLGDGSLRLMGRSREASFVVDHSEKQKDYVLWKYEVLRNWVNREPRTLLRTYHKEKNRFLVSVRFQRSEERRV